MLSPAQITDVPLAFDPAATYSAREPERAR